MNKNIIGFEALAITDIDQVGGKNASLGEMIANLTQSGVQVPGGFATTAAAFQQFLQQNGLAAKINSALSELDIEDIKALAETGKKIRQWVVDTPLPADLQADIRAAYADIERTASNGYCSCGKVISHS